MIKRQNHCVVHSRHAHCTYARTTDTQWRNKSKKSVNLGWCGRQNMLLRYLKIWEWELIFGRAVKAIFAPGVRCPWYLCTSEIFGPATLWFMEHTRLLKDFLDTYVAVRSRARALKSLSYEIGNCCCCWWGCCITLCTGCCGWVWL